MAYSRLSRVEEKKARLRLVAAIFGIVGIIAFFIFFGLQLLIQFSILLDRLHGNTPPDTKSSTFLSAPVLDQIPVATNSALITISGLSGSEDTILLYLNDEKIRDTRANESGYFRYPDVTLITGTNTILTKAVSDTGQTSASSNTVVIKFKKSIPVLELTEPSDGVVISGDSNLITLSGKTEIDNSVTINDRLVVVTPNGEFSYQYPLTDGDNNLKITSIDEFGNSVSLLRQVKYQKP